MIERIEGIVTDIVKHNDTHNVVTLFTRRRGRMAFLVPIGKSKTGRMRNAVINYMAVLGADVNINSNKELHTLRRIESLRVWHGIYSDPVKSALLFFLTEFCHRLLRQYPADEKLWQFLTQSLEILDSARPAVIANFHITFLMRLLPIAGIEPQMVLYSEGLQFDMLSGEMIDTGRVWNARPRALLTESESMFIPLLMRINYRNMNLYRFRAAERKRILEKILAYYSIHLPLGGEFKTLGVLHELFS